MSEQVIVALLPVLGTLGAAGLAWLTAVQARQRAEQKQQRADIDRITRENRALWYYTRALIDWGYRPDHARAAPPEPPESIRHLYEFGTTT